MDLYSKLSSGIEEIVQIFNSRMDTYEKELHKVATTTSPVYSDISSLSRDFVDFKSFVWKTMSMLKSQMELLSLAMDRHETTSRRKVLLFHGVPESKGEKVNEVIIKVLSEQMKLADVSLSDIQVCHRLGTGRGKSRPILVRFVHYINKSQVWNTKTSLKNSGVTISEFLTKPRHQVFTTARKHFGINRCWSSEGKIVIMLPNKSRHKIERMDELQNLMAKYPVIQTSKSDSEPGTPNPEEPLSQDTTSTKIRKTRAPKFINTRSAK